MLLFILNPIFVIIVLTIVVGNLQGHGGVAQAQGRQLASSYPYLSMAMSENKGIWKLRGANREPKVNQSFRVSF